MNSENKYVAKVVRHNTVSIKTYSGSGAGEFSVSDGATGGKLTHCIMNGDDVQCFFDNGKIAIYDIYGQPKGLIH